VDTVEVWRVGPPPPERETRASYTGGSALDRNVEDQIIMEMSGNSMHSKHIRAANKAKREAVKHPDLDDE
jgi:hypothetical protein